MMINKGRDRCEKRSRGCGQGWEETPQTIIAGHETHHIRFSSNVPLGRHPAKVRQGFTKLTH